MSDPKTRLDELVAKLRARDCRITPQRRAILQVLISSKRHPSVEQVYEQIRPDFPMTSLATVYKTVTLLKEMGEVLELGFGDGGNRYDGHRPTPHPHMICNNCGEIVDLEVPVLETLPQQVKQETGYEIVSHRVDFFGVCPKCQKAGHIIQDALGRPAEAGERKSRRREPC
jgi:Fur family peroxide stress response transcriptional regulator